MLANCGDQEIRTLLVREMDVGLFITRSGEKPLGQQVVDPVDVFVLIDFDLVQGEIRVAILTHTGTDHRDLSLGRLIGHELFLLTGDFSFDSAHSALDLFNGVEGTAKLGHPADKGRLFSFQVGAEALELALVVGVIDRWSGR
jgi:hypothetical protein